VSSPVSSSSSLEPRRPHRAQEARGALGDEKAILPARFAGPILPGAFSFFYKWLIFFF